MQGVCGPCFSCVLAGDNSSITRDKLQLMLEAARWAPTHKLTEPWHFVVIGGANKDAFEVCASVLHCTAGSSRQQSLKWITRDSLGCGTVAVAAGSGTEHSACSPVVEPLYHQQPQ